MVLLFAVPRRPTILNLGMAIVYFWFVTFAAAPTPVPPGRKAFPRAQRPILSLMGALAGQAVRSNTFLPTCSWETAGWPDQDAIFAKRALGLDHAWAQGLPADLVEEPGRRVGCKQHSFDRHGHAVVDGRTGLEGTPVGSATHASRAGDDQVVKLRVDVNGAKPTREQQVGALQRHATVSTHAWVVRQGQTRFSARRFAHERAKCFLK